MGAPQHDLKGSPLSASLEARRRAIADALRLVALEAELRESAVVVGVPTEEPAPEERVSVPALALDDVRMSSVAAQALFGH